MSTIEMVIQLINRFTFKANTFYEKERIFIENKIQLLGRTM